MKILISENQLRNVVLSEQSDYMIDQRANAMLNAAGIRSDTDYNTVNKINTKSYQGTESEQAAVKIMMEIGASLLPIVGPIIGTLIGGYYAQDEFSKGNKKTGVLIGVLSLLPLIPQIRKVIPSLTKFNQNALKNLSDKLTGVVKEPLTSIESGLVKELSYQIEPIKQQLTRINEAVKVTVDYKGQYIRTFGETKFQDLFNKLIRGEINKQQYVNELLIGLKDTYKSVKLGTVSGIKFLAKEEDAIVNASKQIQNGKVGDIFKLKLSVNGVESEVKLILNEYPPSAFDMAAKNTKDIILVNMNNIKNFTYEKIVNTLSHEAAHIKDLSTRSSSKMMKGYQNILDNIVKAENMFNDAMAKFGEGSDQVFQARKMYSKYFTKYKYHYMEMVANNAKLMQSLSRRLPDVISQYGVPETQKMLQSMRYGLTKGIPDNINFYMDKFIGADNAKYIKEIRVYDKYLYKDLMKKLYKQLDYMEEQLKLYQQY